MTRGEVRVPKDLPPHTVRRSSRARRVRLTVSPRDGLVIVVPAGAHVDIEAILRSKRDWAERALARVAERHRELSADPDALLPSHVDMPGIGLSLPVEYESRPGSRTIAAIRQGVLVVSGDTDDAEACLVALRRWLAATALAHIPGRITLLAEAYGLSPSRIRVGGARTRWGSCSARGTISMCRNALFLPAHLLDALILHELAHLRVLDHSPRFWAALTEMDANALSHRQELRRAEAAVPAWAAV